MGSGKNENGELSQQREKRIWCWNWRLMPSIPCSSCPQRGVFCCRKDIKEQRAAFREEFKGIERSFELEHMIEPIASQLTQPGEPRSPTEASNESSHGSQNR